VYIRQVVIRERYSEKILRKHRVDEDEITDILADRQTSFRKLQKGRVVGEDIFGAYGQTDSGRYLSVFFIHKINQDAFVLSARDMNNKERNRYAKT
jgi:hypothetical protein